MKIWIDGDACPNLIKDIIFRATRRTQIKTVLVANQHITTPKSPFISTVRVPAGFDAADDFIVQELKTNDLVITADIPLAADILEKGGAALNPRGEMYTHETIKQKLNLRDFMDVMRSSGERTGGPTAYGQTKKQAFANALDAYITKHGKAS